MLVKERNGEVSEHQVSPGRCCKRRFVQVFAFIIIIKAADDFRAFMTVQELVFKNFRNIFTAVNTLWSNFSVPGAPIAVMVFADAAVEIRVIFVCADLFCAPFMCFYVALGTSLIIGLIEKF